MLCGWVIRRKHSVGEVPVFLRWRHEFRERVQKIEWRDFDDAVGLGRGWQVECQAVGMERAFVAGLQEAVQVMADMQLGVRLDDSEAAEIVSFLHSLTREVPVNYSPPETAPGTGGTE